MKKHSSKYINKVPNLGVEGQERTFYLKKFFFKSFIFKILFLSL